MAVNIKDICLEFHGRPLFEDVNFAINPGEKIGIVGRNGSGKSTFLKLLLGKIQPDSGKIEIPDGYSIGYLEQHFNFTHKTVIEEVCSVLPPERIYEEWKASMILSGLGFSDQLIMSDPNMLSGGYQVKVNLSKMLLMESNLLLLDEPTNYLDIYSIKWLGDFLKKWDGELILITHDRAFMENVITHSLIIHRNKFRKVVGKPGRVKEQIAIEEEIYEKTRVAEEKKRKETEEWIRKFGSKASKASAVQSRVKMLEKQEVKEKLVKIDNLDFKFNHLPYGGRKNDVIEVKKLSFGYTPEKMLINNLNFTIRPTDKVCIVGKNGNGKSTLLQLIAGLLNPMTGDITVCDRIQSGYFGQTNIERLNHDLSICEELTESNPDLDIGIIRRTCSNMLFPGDLAHKKISVLSGGEKSRVMLGKILLTKTNLLLLDEPTNHFDMESCEALMDAIQEFPGAVVMVTHNEHFLHEIANKLIIFDSGNTFCFDGSYNEFLKNVGWQEK